MKVKSIDNIVEEILQFAKILSDEGQSAMGVKLAIWCNQIEQAIKIERLEAQSKEKIKVCQRTHTKKVSTVEEMKKKKCEEVRFGLYPLYGAVLNREGE